MSPEDQTPRLMADPSLLLSKEGIELAVSQEFDLVVSRTFLRWLSGESEQDVDPASFFSEEPDDDPGEFVDPLREVLLSQGIDSFSYEEAELDEEAGLVLDRLREDGGLLAEIDADQWAFLNSRSWLGSKSKRLLRAFGRAGVWVLEASKEIGIEMLEEVTGERPRNVDGALIARGVIKWLVVGGASIGGGAVGALAGTFVAGPVGEWVGHMVGDRVAEEAARAVVVAIDP